MTPGVVVLGATGSIGRQTLDVVGGLGLEVLVLAAHNPSPELADLAAAHPAALVVVAGGSTEEREDFARRVANRVVFGSDSILEAAANPDTIVVNGIVGSAGLGATVAALEAGNRVALANKESLVAGGPVVKKSLASGGGSLIPVDSEHSALYQCLSAEPRSSISRLILTASGGPFRGRDRESLADVTPEEALRHPTWDMGPRITIDSATLFNKGLEVIEAHFLFDVGYDQIDVVVHPQSVVHSAVEFTDGSIKAHLGHPDMRIPIQYALTAPDRAPAPVGPYPLVGARFDFEAPDRVAFPALDLAYAAGRQAGSSPAVLNAADEVAVAAFLQGRLGFLGISEVVERTLETVEWREVGDVGEVLSADEEARAAAAALIAGSEASGRRS